MHQINIKIKCYRSSDVVPGPDWKYQYSIVIKMRLLLLREYLAPWMMKIQTSAEDHEEPAALCWSVADNLSDFVSFALHLNKISVRHDER